MTTKRKSDIKWEKDDKYHTYTHIVDELDDPVLDKDMMIRHCFLEFLDYLEIVEYTRGYEGLYYDITIKRRDI